MTLVAYLAPILAFLASFSVLVWIVRSRPGWIPVDQPNARSLHGSPVPRGGGVAIMIGVVVGSALPGTGVTGGLGLILVLAAVSWIDDRRGLPASARFGIQVLCALFFLLLFGDGVSYGMLALAVIVLVWMSNLYNFMDGADGLAGGMTVVGFGCYAIAAWQSGENQLEIICWSVVAGTIAFLAFNFPRARIFMGDVGSVPLGFLAAAIGFIGWRDGLWPAWYPLLVFSFFIVDATVTLVRRALRGEPVWRAHREHAYQRLIRSGWSHQRLTLTSWGLMALAGSTALVILGKSGAVVTLVLAGWSLIYAGLLIAVEICWRRALSQSSS